MGYIEEDQILLHEELCIESSETDRRIISATQRFRDNIRLASSVAHKYSEPLDAAISHEDIEQEAYYGLWRACLNFDESQGYKFATYAVPMINGTILTFLNNNGALKLPRSYRDIRSALTRHGFTLPLTDEEIDILVNEGKFSKAQILDYREVNVISLDRPINEDDEDSLGYFIPDSRRFETEFSEDEIESIIDKIILYIKPRYRDLVEEWMYATLSGFKIPQEMLGVKYNTTRANVNRILRSTISILQMHRDEIRDLFGL